jgi:hypothetical protein
VQLADAQTNPPKLNHQAAGQFLSLRQLFRSIESSATIDPGRRDPTTLRWEDEAWDFVRASVQSLQTVRRVHWLTKRVLIGTLRIATRRVSEETLLFPADASC